MGYSPHVVTPTRSIPLQMDVIAHVQPLASGRRRLPADNAITCQFHRLEDTSPLLATRTALQDLLPGNRPRMGVDASLPDQSSGSLRGYIWFRISWTDAHDLPLIYFDKRENSSHVSLDPRLPSFSENTMPCTNLHVRGVASQSPPHTLFLVQKSRYVVQGPCWIIFDSEL